MPHNIRIAIVDDHPIVIQGLKMMLENERHFTISATCQDGESVRKHIRSHEPDIVLLDIALPDCNGTDLCAEIKKQSPKTAVLMFSNRSERSIILQSLQNGASGYLLKNAAIEELRECIFGALSGKIVFCKEVLEIMQKPPEKSLDAVPRLTKREKEILKLVTDGKTSADIAELLSLSPLTVDTHRKNLLQKFKAKNTAELIQLALRQGAVI